MVIAGLIGRDWHVLVRTKALLKLLQVSYQIPGPYLAPDAYHSYK